MAHATARQRYAFLAEWTDPNSGVRWTYQLFAYLHGSDGPVEIEMFDIKNKRHFLKKVKCEGVKPQQLYIGSTLLVFARQLHLIAYGDEATRRAVEARSERTLALIKPGAVQYAGKIINAIINSGFSIINLHMCQLSQVEAEVFCGAGHGPDIQADASLLSSGPVVAMELMAPSGVRRWLDVLGSLRDIFDANGMGNAVHGSESPGAAAAEVAFFFEGSSSPSLNSSSSRVGSQTGRAARAKVRSCCRCSQTTLGVIQPHAVRDGLAGLMLEEIQAAAFDITGLQQFHLDKHAAAEFLEVYKEVVTPGEFSSMVDELVSGPCIAVEVASQDGREPVEAFRQLVGPRDPELARVLRPHTLRARFGLSRVRNSMHCTDLVEDGPLETSYFFNVLKQQVFM